MKHKNIQIKLRLPNRLRAKIESAAKAKGESMNATMVDRLERSFRDDEVLTEIRALRDDVRAGRLSINEVRGGGDGT